jgi:hypothetical protein
MGLLEILYIGGDIMRPDGGQCQAAILAPRRRTGRMRGRKPAVFGLRILAVKNST